MRALLLLVVVSGCDFFWRLDHVNGVDGDGSTSDIDMAMSDASPVDAGPSWMCNFGMPMAVPGNISNSFEDPVERADRHELYLSEMVPGYDIFVTQRASAADPYPAPMVVSALSTSSLDQDPVLTEDGLTIMFVSERSGSRKVWQADRPTPTSFWLNIREIALDKFADSIDISPDGLTLYFADGHPGTLHAATRANRMATLFEPSMAISSGNIEYASVAGDGLTVYYHRLPQLFRQTRMSTTGTFSGETEVDPDGSDPQISEDGRTLIYMGATNLVERHCL